MPTSKTDQAIQKVADTAHAATEKLADKAEQAVDATRDATDKLAHKAEQAVEATRDATNQALDKAERRVRRLRDDIQPAIDAVAWRAQDAVHDCTTYACRSARLCASRTRAYVAAEPLKSMALAAAAGALLTLLLGRRR